MDAMRRDGNAVSWLHESRRFMERGRRCWTTSLEKKSVRIQRPGTIHSSGGGHDRGRQTSAPELRRTGPDGRQYLASARCPSCFGRPFRILSLGPLVKGRKGGCCESEGYVETHGWFCQEVSPGRSPEGGDGGSGNLPLAQENDATQEGIR
jgi:hypothetical protein